MGGGSHLATQQMGRAVKEGRRGVGFCRKKDVPQTHRGEGFRIWRRV